MNMRKSLVITSIFIALYFILGILTKVAFQKQFMRSPDLNVAQVNNLFIYKYITLTLISLTVVVILYFILLKSSSIKKKYILVFCLTAFVVNFFIERIFL